jgi:hypothetical protein
MAPFWECQHSASTGFTVLQGYRNLRIGGNLGSKPSYVGAGKFGQAECRHPYDQEKTQAPSPLHDDFYRGMTQSQQGQDVRTAACPMSHAEILAALFSYHPPTPETLPKFAAINQAAKNFAEIVLQNCPSSADRSAAIRLIRDARMTANASVALNGLSL